MKDWLHSCSFSGCLQMQSQEETATLHQTRWDHVFLLSFRLGSRLLIQKQEQPLSQPFQPDLIYVTLPFMSCDQQNKKAEPLKFSKWSIIYLNLRNIILHKRFFNSYTKSIWFRPVVVNQWAAMLMDKEIQIYNASNQRGRSDAAHCMLCALFTWQGRLGNHHQVPGLPPLGTDLLL